MNLLNRPAAAAFRLGLFLVNIVLFATVLHAAPPPLLLAKVYAEQTSLDGYWISEKLDGVRAYWDGKRLWSRQGHIYAAPPWFTAGFPREPLDGELWMGRGTFARLSAAVRRYRPDETEWRQIRYQVFDLPHSGLPFSARLQRLRQLVGDSPSRFIGLVEQTPATNHAELMERLDKVLAKGGEGLMLHHGDSLYRAGRSDRLLKVKRYQDAEAVVVGHTEGKGKYAGMLGALVVQLPDRRRLRIGTGFSDAQRRSPPAIGATITYQYIGLTASGLPRFASFLRVRNDEPLGSIDNNE
ncbi:DNA ligase [Marinobacter sp. X15-166B]|uniref:DNA ligase n=1 Tax=Marinobacter sp. X15-166B TaxID=1897620 RepID=UPI00085C31F2|nr:DNA ligase [Marinobacter sp. X15-166B]OEY65820.1 DNA ligase [Marinobacter sp. X15-166B]